MKKLSCISALLVMAACGNKEQNNTVATKADPSQLVMVDKEFSKMSAEKGLKAAFLYYAADSAIKLRNKEFPVIGKDEIKKMFEEDPAGNQTTLTWTPVRAEIGAANDLGYTFGNWKMRIDDSTSATSDTFYGNYITIWKKQPDGSWKWVLDGGNNTPGPSAK